MWKTRTALPVVLTILASITTRCSSVRNAVTTRCSQEAVTLPALTNGILTVNLSFPDPIAVGTGLTCRWEIPPPNATSSTQIFIHPPVRTNFPALACGMGAVALHEKVHPPSGDSGSTSPHQLSLPPCLSVNPAAYSSAVMTRPGFSLLVTLRFNSTSSEAYGNVTLFTLQPIVWAGVYPHAVFRTLPSTHTAYTHFAPRRKVQISRMPDYFVCRWVFQSPGGEVVKLKVRAYPSNSSAPRCSDVGDRLLVQAYSQSNTAITAGNSHTFTNITIPVCHDPAVMKHDITSTAGQVNVTFQTDGTGGAYEQFYFDYWHEDGCPTQMAYLEASQDEEKFFKGVSFYRIGSNDSSDGNSQSSEGQTCSWTVYNSNKNLVIKLTRLDASQFHPNCEASQDYLELGTTYQPRERLSLCHQTNSDHKIPDEFPVWIDEKRLLVRFNSSSNNNNGEPIQVFPVWSEGNQFPMFYIQNVIESSTPSSASSPLSSSSSSSLPPRSFMLHYRAVKKGQCQGYAARRTVGSSGLEEKLEPIPAGDRFVNGPFCLWLFTARNSGHVLQLNMTIPKTDAVCSHNNFAVYNINSTVLIITSTGITEADRIGVDCSNSGSTATSEENRRVVTYTGRSRSMLVAYRRDNLDKGEKGFSMTLRQIPDPATSGGMGMGGNGGWMRWVWCIWAGWWVVSKQVGV